MQKIFKYKNFLFLLLVSYYSTKSIYEEDLSELLKKNMIKLFRFIILISY